MTKLSPEIQAFREKLKEITAPVCQIDSLKSYDILCDVITNVILFEINLDKKPLDAIPRREIKLKTIKDQTAEFVERIWYQDDSRTLMMQKLMELFGSDYASYNDCDAINIDNKTLAGIAVFIAIKNYLSFYPQN